VRTNLLLKCALPAPSKEMASTILRPSSSHVVGWDVALSWVNLLTGPGKCLRLSLAQGPPRNNAFQSVLAALTLLPCGMHAPVAVEWLRDRLPPNLEQPGAVAQQRPSQARRQLPLHLQTAGRQAGVRRVRQAGRHAGRSGSTRRGQVGWWVATEWQEDEAGVKNGTGCMAGGEEGGHCVGFVHEQPQVVFVTCNESSLNHKLQGLMPCLLPLRPRLWRCTNTSHAHYIILPGCGCAPWHVPRPHSVTEWL
jgi:hypothetical protein